MKFRVFNNYIKQDNFNALQELLLSDKIAWYHQENMTVNDNSFMSHGFFHENAIQSNFYVPGIVPILEQMKIDAVINIRANLTYSYKKVVKSQWHCDVSGGEQALTSILYINDNNGYTEFITGEKVQAKANRMVVFPSTLEHRMLGASDIPNRIVINFNFYSLYLYNLMR